MRIIVENYRTSKCGNFSFIRGKKIPDKTSFFITKAFVMHVSRTDGVSIKPDTV